MSTDSALNSLSAGQRAAVDARMRDHPEWSTLDLVMELVAFADAANRSLGLLHPETDDLVRRGTEWCVATAARAAADILRSFANDPPPAPTPEHP